MVKLHDVVRPDMDPHFEWLPDHSLMVAVLIQAAHDLTLAGINTYLARRSRHTNEYRSGDTLAREARWWFECHDMDWPFAFERICLELRLDPDAVRRELLGDGGQPRHRIGRTAGFRDRSRKCDWPVP